MNEFSYRFRPRFWVWLAVMFIVSGAVGWFPYYITSDWRNSLLAHAVGFGGAVFGFTLIEISCILERRSRAIVDSIRARGPSKSSRARVQSYLN